MFRPLYLDGQGQWAPQLFRKFRGRKNFLHDISVV